MKSHSQAELEDSRPEHETPHCVGHCLKKLFEDQSRSIDEEVVAGLTFEELIGALLLAKDDFQELEFYRCREADDD